MRPPTATLEAIKAYQEKVEKNKIIPDNLPPCPRCSVDSSFFKIHAYRERRFWVIVEMFIKAAFCTLVRFRCPGCGKTFTFYPPFAIPYKHYSRQSLMGFSAHYLESDDTTYQQAVMVENSAPGYAQNDSTLAPSTIYRWITSLCRFTQSCRTALLLLLQQNPLSNICRNLAQVLIPQRKFKTHLREKQLIGCRQLLVIEAVFKAAFKTSIFTKLATRCAFS
jgi:hypothetical protein